MDSCTHFSAIPSARGSGSRGGQPAAAPCREHGGTAPLQGNPRPRCRLPGAGHGRADGQTGAATSPPHLGKEGRGGDPLAVEHAAQRRDEVLHDQGQPGPGVACHGAADRRGRVTHTGTLCGDGLSPRKQRCKTRQREEGNAALGTNQPPRSIAPGSSVARNRGVLRAGSCARRPRDPRAERGEALAPSPAPWGVSSRAATTCPC